jgi:FixJ family two-component response regulator
MKTNGSSPPPHKPIVSVVEDDEAMRSALTDLLDSAGCQTLAFGSSEEFLNSATGKLSDVVITDIQMAGLDGLGLLNRIRATLRPPVPVIVITALTDERLEHRAVAEGCYAFLRKPVNPETLLGLVRDAVNLPRETA